MLAQIYTSGTVFDFGKYEGETLLSVFVKNPSYIKWCVNNIGNFCISPDEFDNLIDELMLNANSSRNEHEKLTRLDCFKYFEDIYEVNLLSFKRISGLYEPKDWSESNSEWREKWFNIIPEIFHRPLLTRSEENIYSKWLAKFNQNEYLDTKPWTKKVQKNLLAEVSHRVIIMPGSAHHADFKILDNYVLLIEKELSKIELLSREAFFDKTVWIVNMTQNDSMEQRIKGSIQYGNFAKKYKSAKDYLKFYQEEIDSSREIIEQQVQRGKALPEYHTKKVDDTSKHIENFTAGRVDLSYYFEEDWNKCIDINSDDVKPHRFQYIASPVFLDMGGYLYLRKFARNDYSSPGLPYLKEVSYADFLKWLNGQNIDL